MGQGDIATASGHRSAKCANQYHTVMEERSSSGRVRVSGRKDGGVQAPIDLGGLFGGSDDENDGSDVKDGSFENTSELQTLVVGDRNISVRQYSWHEANANQVWPGTFVLAEFLTTHIDRYNKSCLELGSATGALAIYLRLCGYERVVTWLVGAVESYTRFGFTNQARLGPCYIFFRIL